MLLSDCILKGVYFDRFSEAAKLSFRNEAALMKDLAHPKVLIYRGFFDNEYDIGIVMEFMENGSLLDAIEKRDQFGQDTILSIAYDVAAGLNYLHLRNILHHDLKIANVFLDQYNRAKVGDFGLSQMKNESSTRAVNPNAGTLQYLGPECFGSKAIFVFKSDVYAYSVVLWELINWECAYEGVEPYNISIIVRGNERLPIPDVDYGLGELIMACWQQEYEERPTFEELLTILEPLLPSFSNHSIAGSSSQSPYRSSLPDSSRGSYNIGSNRGHISKLSSPIDNSGANSTQPWGLRNDEISQSLSESNSKTSTIPNLQSPVPQQLALHEVNKSEQRSNAILQYTPPNQNLNHYSNQFSLNSDQFTVAPVNRESLKY